MMPCPHEAAGILCAWIEDHLDRFRPAPRDAAARLRDVKPLAELAIILAALTGPRQRPAGGALVPWAERLADRLWPEVQALAAAWDWGRIAAMPSAADLVCVFPMMERAAGRRFAFRNSVGAALHAMPPSLPRSFVLDISGIGDCRAEALTALDKAAARCRVRPSLSPLYDLTHAVFFATGFGWRAAAWTPEQRDLLHGWAGDCALARLGAGYFDIAAELLAGMAWAGAGGPPDYRTGIGHLARVAAEQGSIPIDPRSTDPGFDSRYHPTLISLAALADAALPAAWNQP